jgi:hypothetical protein
MVFNATFINIDIILWQLVLLMEYLVVENFHNERKHFYVQFST